MKFKEVELLKSYDLWTKPKKQIDLKNVRLHRDDKGNKEGSFYWDVVTLKKVDESHIPKFTYTPEQQYYGDEN